MKNQLLCLSFTDMLIYSLFIKSRTKIDQEEVKFETCYTPPQAYFWIFLLNQKNKKTLPLDKEYVFIRLIFWVMQIVYHMKQFFRKRQNRKSNIFLSGIFFSKQKLNIVTYFYNQFIKELTQSSLELKQKQAITQLTDEKIKSMYHFTYTFLQKDLNNLHLHETEYWGKITYEQNLRTLTT